MLARFRAAGLVWPTLFSLAALAVLIGLGTWQMQRKAWKDEVVSTLERRTLAAPASGLGFRCGVRDRVPDRAASTDVSV